MAKCERCLWSDQCYTLKNSCGDYTPLDEDEALEEGISEEKCEFRDAWEVYEAEFKE